MLLKGVLDYNVYVNCLLKTCCYRVLLKISAKLWKVNPKNYTLFIVVHKDFKNCKTNRSELDEKENLKKKTIQFLLSFNLYFQQKIAAKLSICHLRTKRSVWVFDVTNRANGFSNFQSYLKVVMYLFNSLVKSCTLFWKYS